MSDRVTPDGVPSLIAPMRPATVLGDPLSGPDWVVEVAWTGHRCIAYVEPGQRVRLLSGAGNSMTAAFPELAQPLLLRCPPGGMVLDGTLVARGEEHAVRPRLLTRRSARANPTPDIIARIPVDLQVADLLWLGGHSTVGLSYADRRALLDRLGFASPPVWSTSPLPADELATMLAIAERKGADGLHARHVRGRYHPGGRSRFWLRVPVTRTRQVLVGGWTPADPRRPDSLGALLLGAPAADPGTLHYVGRVGVSVEQRRVLAGLLTEREHERSPFVEEVPADVGRHGRWVRPELIGLAEFSGWIGGRTLRRPRWCGLADPGSVRDDRWADPPEPEPVSPQPADPPSVEAHRLEQHFVYNALNTIAALIRSDPGRARELLVGFAELTRATDRAGAVPLDQELGAVRAYLELEQARFGDRLRVQLDVPEAVLGVPVAPARLLAVVRDVVQHGIEPLPGGGVLAVSAHPVAGGCEVRVTGGGAGTRMLRLPS